jgi:hypothetical protein
MLAVPRDLALYVSCLLRDELAGAALVLTRFEHKTVT